MDSTRIRGVHDLSFPVLDPRGNAVAAMTMPYIERIDVEDVAVADARGALGETAQALSGALSGVLGAGASADPARVSAPPARAPVDAARTPEGPDVARVLR
jgi:hypothetical protein